jgi:hypothetical protein
VTDLAIDTRFGSGAIKVDLGRGSAIAIAIGVPLLALTEFGFVYVVIDTDDTGTKIVGLVFAAIFGLLLLFVLMMLPHVWKPRGLAFNERGVHYWERDTSNFLGWESIAAIGIGYEQPPELPVISLEDFVGNKIKEGLKIDHKRALGVEIFPADPSVLDKQPLLVRYRREQEPPSPNLPAARWRIPLPPAPGLVAKVKQGVETHQPARWLGFFKRPWRGGLGA